jgi:ribosomal-protein-alanine N-acetyltransferase
LTQTGPPSWPAEPIAYGPVILRELSDIDIPMVRELSADAYVPLISGIPPDASRHEAQAWIEGQQGHRTGSTRLSFAIAEAGAGRGAGTIVLGLAALARGRASAGYSVAPSARGIAAAALTALTRFAWTIPALYRIELYIEPWNTASIRAAERSGYEREGLLRSHQEIGGRRRDMLLYASIRPGTRSSEP